MRQVTLEQAQAAKRVASERFRDLGTVVGVGITRIAGEYAVKINLSAPIDPGTVIPTDIGGVPVRVEVTGAVRAR